MGERFDSHALDQREARKQLIYGKEALLQLRQPSVAIVGTGLLGGEIALQLGGLGVPLILVDQGIVRPVNVGGQGFQTSQIGLPKVEARAAQISECTSDPKLHLIHNRIEDVGVGVFSRTRLIISALDNRSSRIRLAEIALLLGIPMIDLAVDGSGRHLLGSVALYEPRQPDAPCYSCKIGASEIAAIRNEGRGAGCPNWRETTSPKTPPTLAAAPFGALISGLASTWAIAVLLGRADCLASTQVQICADSTPTLRSLEMRRSSHCVMEHSALQPLRTVSAKIAIGELAKRAAKDLGGEPDAFQLRNRNFVSELVCPVDGQTRFLPRCSRGYDDAELICGCTKGAVYVPREQSDRIGSALWRRLSRMKFQELALPAADIVTAVARDGRAAHYIIGRPPAPRVLVASGSH
jgi:molybdopterin/thiamine biosynthesis adenylyltransferase